LSASPWTERVWHEFRAGNLTRTWRDVLLSLHGYRGCGSIWPSHATLAQRCKCSVKSVQRALQAGRALGLVSWATRRIKALWRSLQASNRYVLALPEGAVNPCHRRAPSTGGHLARGEERKNKQRRCERDTGALAEIMHAASALPDLLVARRAALTQRWRTLAQLPLQLV
jgi:hypothetical protein